MPITSKKNGISDDEDLETESLIVRKQIQTDISTLLPKPKSYVESTEGNPTNDKEPMAKDEARSILEQNLASPTYREEEVEYSNSIEEISTYDSHYNYLEDNISSPSHLTQIENKKEKIEKKGNLILEESNPLLDVFSEYNLEHSIDNYYELIQFITTTRYDISEIEYFIELIETDEILNDEDRTNIIQIIKQNNQIK